MTNEEKYKNVQFLYNAAKNQPKSFYVGLLQILLAWGPKANIYDMELFKQFADFHEKLNSHNSVMKTVLKAVRKKLYDRHENTNWASYFKTLQETLSCSPSSIAKEYLTHYAF